MRLIDRLSGETIYAALVRVLGREPTFAEEWSQLGAVPAGCSEVDPGRKPANMGEDAGVRSEHERL